MEQDEHITQNTHELVESGLKNTQKLHQKKLHQVEKARIDAVTNEKERKIKEMQRKQERRLQREIRVKEQIKAQLRAEIFKHIVDKGEQRYPSTNYELADLHANYTEKLLLTTLGGHFQQLYYVVAAVLAKYGDNLDQYYARKQANPSDDQSKKA